MTTPDTGEAAAVERYAGFWIRVVAALIDTALLLIITVPILLTVYGRAYLDSDKWVEGPLDFLLTWVLPAIAVIVFWMYKQATPGKMAVKTRIVDAATGGRPTTGQFIGRYFAYYLSILPLFLGLIWVAFDRRKQGFHDKLAGNVVVRRDEQHSDVARFGR